MHFHSVHRWSRFVSQLPPKIFARIVLMNADRYWSSRSNHIQHFIGLTVVLSQHAHR
jgi:hypothetical protein